MAKEYAENMCAPREPFETSTGRRRYYSRRDERDDYFSRVVTRRYLFRRVRRVVRQINDPLTDRCRCRNDVIIFYDTSEVFPPNSRTVFMCRLNCDESYAPEMDGGRKSVSGTGQPFRPALFAGRSSGVRVFFLPANGPSK